MSNPSTPRRDRGWVAGDRSAGIALIDGTTRLHAHAVYAAQAANLLDEVTKERGATAIFAVYQPRRVGQLFHISADSATGAATPSKRIDPERAHASPACAA
jgi:hypothetical protein